MLSHNLQENATLILPTLSLSEILLSLWALTQLHSGHTNFFFWVLICSTTYLIDIPKSLNICWFDDLRAVNNNPEFFSSFRKVYSKELESNVELQGKHNTFLDLDITIEDGLSEQIKFNFSLFAWPSVILIQQYSIIKVLRFIIFRVFEES